MKIALGIITGFLLILISLALFSSYLDIKERDFSEIKDLNQSRNELLRDVDILIFQGTSCDLMNENGPSCDGFDIQKVSVRAKIKEFSLNLIEKCPESFSQQIIPILNSAFHLFELNQQQRLVSQTLFSNNRIQQAFDIFREDLNNTDFNSECLTKKE